MTMTLADLEAAREGWDFEAKKAHGKDGTGAVPDSFWPTYSAMANSAGGLIVLGVGEREDHSLYAAGLSDIEKVERNLWNTLGDRHKVSANVLNRDDVTRVEVDGLQVLLVRVPKADRSQRPVYLNGSWERHTYARVNDGDRAVAADIARRMLADAQPNRDGQVLQGFTRADLDDDTIRRYREILSARRPEHPFLQTVDNDFLTRIGAWGRDRERATEGPTLGGLLMFGKERSLRDRFAHWHLSFREEPAEAEASRRWIDRVAPDGTWEANVFAFYLRVVPKLYAGVKAPFGLDAGMYRRDEGPVHEALREAFINALIHADYEGTSGVRIIRRPDGYEFINPGLPLVAVEQVWKGGSSAPRNPALQHLFSMVQLGEREGSGGPKIRQAWLSQHWQSPVLHEDTALAETHLRLSQLSLLPEASVDYLRQRWGQRFVALDELARLTLVTAHAEERVSHARIRELTDQHSRSITLKLQELVRNEFLVSSGERRGTTYSLAPDASTGGLGQQGDAGNAQRTLFGDGVLWDSSSPQSFPQSSRQSFPQSLTQGHKKTRETSASATVSRVAANSWSAKDEIRIAILEVCRIEYRTVAEIATALNRKASTIQQNYVAELVAEGVLELRYPKSRRHPAQAYRTRQDTEATP